MWLYCHFGALAALSACVGRFFCGFCFVALRAEDLKVLVAVVVGAALVVDVVDFQALGAAALGAFVAVTCEYSFTCSGGDVCGVTVSPHCSPPSFFVPYSSRELVACVPFFGCVVR